MSASTILLQQARRSLSGQLARLGANLTGLGQQLRESVSSALGRAASEAVRQAVGCLMRQPGEADLFDEPPSYHRSDQRHEGLSSIGEPQRAFQSIWGEHDRLDDWHEPEDDPWRQRAHHPWRRDDDEPEEDSHAEQAGPHPATTRWRSILAAGCRLVAWLLGRLATPGARMLGLGAGLATGLAVWLAGATATTGSLTDTLASTASALAGLAG